MKNYDEKVVNIKDFKNRKNKKEHFDAIEFAKRKLIEENPRYEKYYTLGEGYGTTIYNNKD